MIIIKGQVLVKHFFHFFLFVREECANRGIGHGGAHQDTLIVHHS